MGLARTHLQVAAEIGVDAFLAMWRIYDGDQAYCTDKGDLEIRMRPYRSYLRYQRNRFIEALIAQGLTQGEIQKRVKEDLCEKVSTRHISRVGRGR